MRDMIMIVDESLVNECQAAETRQMVWFVDATVESRPMVVSNFNVPEASGNFCTRGGRFGAHSANESTAPVFHKKLAFVTWFNAGVRAIDIRDPYSPKEVGYFIPAITEATDKRCIKVDGQDRCKIAIQSNNVETDDRGYIYVVDRANTGMHILELTGEARAVGRDAVVHGPGRQRNVAGRSHATSSNVGAKSPVRLKQFRSSRSHPAVEPGDAVVGLFRRARCEHLVAQLRRRAARMIEIAVDARHDLHPRGAQIALLHVGAEGRRQVVGMLADLVGERRPRPRSPCRRPARDIAASDGRRRPAA